MRRLSNANGSPGWAHTLTILPALLLPLLAVGFTVEHVLRLGSLNREVQVLRKKLRFSTPGIPARVRDLELFDRHAGEMLAKQLRQLVPAELDMVAVYGAARRAAEWTDIVLTSIQTGTYEGVDGVGTSIASRGLSLMGRGDVNHLSQIVRNLRGLGFPCEVKSPRHAAHWGVRRIRRGRASCRCGRPDRVER